MRQYLSGVDIANAVRMRGEGWHDAFVVVEGDTDARFYKRFVFRSSDDRHGVVIAHGRNNLLECLDILTEDAAFADRVVGIADRDFWALGEGHPPEHASLMLTDGRDLELMVLRSPALPRLVDGYGSEDKVKDLKRPVEELLLDAGEHLGYLRWLNERERRAPDQDDTTEHETLTRDGARLRLDFNKLKFDRWLDKKTLQVDQPRLLQALASQSRQALHEHRVSDAIAGLRAHAADHGYDSWDICCGHDLIELLKVGLRALFGTCNTGEVERMERVLMQSIYKEEEFTRTSLYASMQQWQNNQSGAVTVRLIPSS